MVASYANFEQRMVQAYRDALPRSHRQSIDRVPGSRRSATG